IGDPLDETQIIIAGETGNPLETLEVGEILVACRYIAPGYWQRPEATTKVFIQHKKYGTVYRTGDLGRQQADGTIEYLGRQDSQVKIRGYRVEPGEIESNLMEHTKISESVITVQKNEEGEKYLCAYYVTTEKIETNELRNFLMETLPDYMIPLYFIRLEKMPLTPGGKTDRKALPEPDTHHTQQQYTPPRNDAEKKLTRIWADTLNIKEKEIGIDNDFFQIGGHSLRATILVSKIHKEFNIKVPLAEIFKKNTIRTLAETIKTFTKKKYSTLQPEEKKEYYALSSAQKRMYFLQQMDLNSTAYNMPLILPVTLGGPVTPGEPVTPVTVLLEKLEEAAGKLVRRHESLRTTFELLGEAPIQRIHDTVEFNIEYYEHTHRAQTTALTGEGKKNDTTAEIVEEIIKGFIRPFDLSHAPLLRSRLIKQAVPGEADGNYILLVDTHHIISDGTSCMLLADDFLSLYNGKELKPLGLQYKDYSIWQNKLIANGELKTREDYWLELYRGESPRLNLLTDYKRPEVFTNAGANHSFTMTPRETAGIKTLAADSGGTLYMNLLAILNTLFYKYTGQTDIIIGTGIAGRPHAELQQIVGMFINTLAMRNFPQGEKNYRTFFSEVIASSIQAFENQEVQFEALVDKLEPKRELSRNPLFDISMVVQNFSTTHLEEWPRTEGEAELPETGKEPPALKTIKTTSKFDLTFIINPLPEEIRIDIEYYTGIFKPATIQRLAAHFMSIVNTVIENPAIPLDEISIITENEKHEILNKFNDTPADYPRDKTIHQLFEEQVEKTPDNIGTVGSRQYAVGKEKTKDKEEIKGKKKLKDNKEIKEQLPQMEATPSFPSIRSTPSTHKAPLQESQSRQTHAVTYRELNKKANTLAYIMQSKGVKPGAIVAIMLERSIEMIIGLMAILKTGAAYLPIDPQYPKERINYILADSNAGIILKEIEELN
ncbi:MAG: AMP-binding protein, partial [bacterium]|nr:AMP-binding protein [bacterium]